MPTSYMKAISTIMETVVEVNPESILDIGVGFGKYGLLCREALDIPVGKYHKSAWNIRIDGIEIFEEYRNPVHDYVYDKVYYGNVNELIDSLSDYDLILLIDVLEHFT